MCLCCVLGVPLCVACSVFGNISQCLCIFVCVCESSHIYAGTYFTPQADNKINITIIFCHDQGHGRSQHDERWPDFEGDGTSIDVDES